LYLLMWRTGKRRCGDATAVRRWQLSRTT
jgi:hypothetical protein